MAMDLFASWSYKHHNPQVRATVRSPPASAMSLEPSAVLWAVGAVVGHDPWFMLQCAMVDSGEEQLSYFTQNSCSMPPQLNWQLLKSWRLIHVYFFVLIWNGAFLKVSAMLSEREREGVKHLSSTSHSASYQYQAISIPKSASRYIWIRIHFEFYQLDVEVNDYIGIKVASTCDWYGMNMGWISMNILPRPSWSDVAESPRQWLGWSSTMENFQNLSKIHHRFLQKMAEPSSEMVSLPIFTVGLWIWKYLKSVMNLFVADPPWACDARDHGRGEFLDVLLHLATLVSATAPGHGSGGVRCQSLDWEDFMPCKAGRGRCGKYANDHNDLMRQVHNSLWNLMKT